MHKLNQITKKGSCVTENELHFVGRQPKLSINLGLSFSREIVELMVYPEHLVSLDFW